MFRSIIISGFLILLVLSSSLAASAEIRPVAMTRYAQVLTRTFQALPRKEGIWRGRIKGNGQVHLTLNLFSRGVLKSSLYMGSVTLRNKETSFIFRSALPNWPSLSWEIQAQAS